LAALHAAGFPFEKLGEWTKDVTCVLSEAGIPGVYIWVVDGVAVYLGEGRSVSLRQTAHSKSLKGPSRELRAALAKGDRVTIHWIRDPRASWNGMDLPARRAIEHALLLDWVFAWNRAGQGQQD
jgi:hypothetical protein